MFKQLFFEKRNDRNSKLPHQNIFHFQIKRRETFSDNNNNWINFFGSGTLAWFPKEN